MIRLKKINHNETTCLSCGAKLEYDKEDVRIGEGGYDVVVCPECGEETPVSEKRTHPPIFPTTFHAFRCDEGAKNISDKVIQDWTDEVWKKMKYLSPGKFACAGSGNTMVIGLKYADENSVIVAKDYWEDSEDINEVEE